MNRISYKRTRQHSIETMQVPNEKSIDLPILEKSCRTLPFRARNVIRNDLVRSLTVRSLCRTRFEISQHQ